MNQVAHAAGMRVATFRRGPLLQPRRQGRCEWGNKSGGRPTCANPITGDHLPQRTSRARFPPCLGSGEAERNARPPSGPFLVASCPRPLTALECTPRHARDGEVDYAHVLGVRGRFAVVQNGSQISE
ncbi:hypothetical protein MTO96_021265 [Rhipicephalus appendiculatus]